MSLSTTTNPPETEYQLGYPGTRGVLPLRVSVAGESGDFIAAVVGKEEIADIFGSGSTRDEARRDLQLALRVALAHLTEREEMLSPRLKLQLECLRQVFGPSEISLRATSPVSTSHGLRPLAGAASNYRVAQYAQ